MAELLLKGMRERLQSGAKLRVTMPEDPKTTVVLGSGTLAGCPRKNSDVERSDKTCRCGRLEELVVSY